MASKKSGSNQLGSWSFLIGVVLAILLGLGYEGAYATQMVLIVFLLGLIIGFLNVTSDEVSAFLTAGTVLVIVSFLGGQAGVFDGVAPMIKGVLDSILTLFVPATIVVAIRNVWVLARN